MSRLRDVRMKKKAEEAGNVIRGKGGKTFSMQKK